MTLSNLFFMYGEDKFSLHQELQRWKQAFIEKFESDTNLEELDGSQLSPKELLGCVRSLPFLSDKRLVLVKNFLASHNADVKNELIEELDKLPEDTILVFAEEGEPDKRNSFTKWLLESSTVRIFNKMEGSTLQRWIQRRTSHHGGQMHESVALVLAEAVGNDLWKLENEIQKLCLYAGDQPISLEMINELVTGNVEESIFTLTDQLAHKDHAGVLQSLKDLQEQGQEAPFLFAMIVRQFRLMLEMKALSENRLTSSMIAQKMKVHPFVVQKSLAHCRNFTYAELKGALAKLLELECRLKSGGIHLRTREEDHYLLALERILLQGSTLS